MKQAKVWLLSVVLLGMLAVQVLPACAFTVSFSTEADPSIVLGPYISGSDPVNGASGVSPYGPYWVRFSGNVFGGAGSIQLKKASDNSVVAYTQYLTGLNSMDGLSWVAGVRLTPNATLDSGTEYYISIPQLSASTPGDTGTMSPLNTHNAPYWNAANNDFEIHFTTSQQLTVNSTNIGGTAGVAGGGQSSVSVTAVIKVMTNNALNGSTVNATNVVLHEGSTTGTVVTADAVLDSADNTNKTIKVTPNAALKYSTTYYLVVTNVADTGGQILP